MDYTSLTSLGGEKQANDDVIQRIERIRSATRDARNFRDRIGEISDCLYGGGPQEAAEAKAPVGVPNGRFAEMDAALDELERVQRQIGVSLDRLGNLG